MWIRAPGHWGGERELRLIKPGTAPDPSHTFSPEILTITYKVLLASVTLRNLPSWFQLICNWIRNSPRTAWLHRAGGWQGLELEWGETLDSNAGRNLVAEEDERTWEPGLDGKVCKCKDPSGPFLTVYRKQEPRIEFSMGRIWRRMISGYGTLGAEDLPP